MEAGGQLLWAVFWREAMVGDTSILVIGWACCYRPQACFSPCPQMGTNAKHNTTLLDVWNEDGQ